MVARHILNTGFVLCPNMVLDKRGRPLRDLRVSLTDRCNMRCTYCMPKEHYNNEHVFLPKSEVLSYEEFALIIESLVPLGLEKVRITGGEPLMRRDLPNFIAMLPKNLDIAMTTNGIMLARHVKQLKEAGLDRVTVSLDAIDTDTFQKMSDSNYQPEMVLTGIKAALQAGLGVKVNCVVRAGINEHAVREITNYFNGSDVVVRFIEFMDVGETNSWNLDEVISGDEIRSRFEGLEPLKPTHKGEVANRYNWNGQELGFIESVSKPFCGDCSRARISANGSLYTCLFASKGYDLKGIIRMGATESDIAKAVRSIWTDRDDAYSELRGIVKQEKIEMSYIGG